MSIALVEDLDSVFSAQQDAIDGILAVLDEGSMNGTPKLGLLLSILECTARANESRVIEGALEISGAALADAYLGVYWNHATNFHEAGVLRQVGSSNRQHFGISKCLELRTLLVARGVPNSTLASWIDSQAILESVEQSALRSALTATERELWKNPIQRIQWIGGREWTFLFEQHAENHSIVLNQGVGSMLASFGSTLRLIIERRFAQVVERLNAPMLDVALEDTVYGHLFLDGDRVMPNDEARRALLDLQQGRCMWTGDRLGASFSADHVAPWSRRQVSVLENFVLTTKASNSSKSAYLLDAQTLNAWLSWLSVHVDEICQIAKRTSFVTDLTRPINALVGLYRSNRRIPLWNHSQGLKVPTPQDLYACTTLLSEFKMNHDPTYQPD